MEKHYLIQLEELRDTIIFTEEDAEEEKNVLKNQLHCYIKENLEFKMQNENMKDESELKDKEIQKYQQLVENYQKALNENIASYTNGFTLKEYESRNESSEFVYVSKIEKLEYDKIIINNDLLQAKREISNLTLENTCLECKIKDLEIMFKGRLDNMKEENLILEKKLSEIENKYSFAIKNKESMLKDLVNLKEITKQNEDLKQVIFQTNKELQALKETSDNLEKNNEQLTKANNSLEKQYNSVKVKFNENDAYLNRIINELREKASQNINQLEEFKDEISSYKLIQGVNINKMNAMAEVNYNIEYSNRCLTEKVENIKIYMAQNNLEVVNKELVDLDINNFDNKICLIIRTLSNEITNLKFDIQIKQQMNLQQSNIISSLEMENEFLKSSSERKTQEFEDKICNLKFYINDLKRKIDEKLLNVKSGYKVQIQGIEANYQAAIEHLKEENEKLAHNLNSNQRDVNKYLDNIKSLNEENVELRFSAQGLRNDLDYFRKAINVVLNEVEAKLYYYGVEAGEDGVENKSPEVVISYRLKQFINILDNLNNSIYLKDKEIQMLSEDNSRYEARLALLESKLNPLNEKVASFEKKFNDSNKLNKELKSKVEALNNEKDKLTKELNNNKIKYSDLLNQIKSYKDIITRHEKEITSKDDQLCNIYNDLNNLKKENENLRSEIEIKTQQYRVLENSEEITEYETKAAKLLEILETTKNTYECKLEKLKNEHQKKLFEFKEITDLEKEELEKKIATLISQQQSLLSLPVEEEKLDPVVAPSKSPIQTNPAMKKQLGFFGSILAPIFLTEKDIENMQK
jgi:chromosome segregation ATPase